MLEENYINQKIAEVNGVLHNVLALTLTPQENERLTDQILNKLRVFERNIGLKEALSRLPIEDRPYILSSIMNSLLHETFISSNWYQQQELQLSHDQKLNLRQSLSQIFACNTLLSDRRSPCSDTYRNNYQAILNSEFHGEFAFGLLQILNDYHLYIDKDSDPDNPHTKLYHSVLALANIADKAQYVTNKTNKSPLSWADTPQTAIDRLLPQRLSHFKQNIDRHISDNHEALTTAQVLPPLATIDREKFGLVIWNRFSERDPERCTNPGLVIEAIEVLKQTYDCDLNVIVLGDEGGLSGLQEQISAYHPDSQWIDHRGQHLKGAGTHVLPKEEQLFVLRHLLAHYDPSLVIGARSGLIALNAMLSCPAIQIDEVSHQSTQISGRIQSRASRKASSNQVPNLDIPSKNALSLESKRLQDNFVRCEVGGLGPHLVLTTDSSLPNKSHRTKGLSTDLLKHSVIAMTVTQPRFKSLMLEQLAGYLVTKNQLSLNTLKLFIKLYLEQQQTKQSVKRAIPETKDDNGDDRKPSGHDDDKDDNDDQPPRPGSGSGTIKSLAKTQQTTNKSHAATSAYGGQVRMNAHEYFEDFLDNIDAKKNLFQDLCFDDKALLCFHAAAQLSIEVIEPLFNTVISAAELPKLLSHDNYLLFEYALSDSQEFYFLIDKLEHELFHLLIANDLYFMKLISQMESHADSQQILSFLNTKLETQQWQQLLLANDCRLLAILADNFSVDYAWSFYAEIQKTNPDRIVHALQADNYAIIRLAARDDNAETLLVDISKYQNLKTMTDAVNAYDGDVVFQLLLKGNVELSLKYYPDLTAQTKLALQERVYIQAPHKNRLLTEIIEKVNAQKSHTSIVSSLDDSAPKNDTNTSKAFFENDSNPFSLLAYCASLEASSDSGKKDIINAKSSVIPDEDFLEHATALTSDCATLRKKDLQPDDSTGKFSISGIAAKSSAECTDEIYKSNPSIFFNDEETAPTTEKDRDQVNLSETIR